MAQLEGLLGYEGRVTIGTVQVDASISEAHDVEADVTDHPVESGADISDHYRVRPRSVQIQGKISNTPLATQYPGKTLVNSFKSINQGSDFVQDAWKNINSFFDEAKVLNINTSLQTYPNVVLKKVSVTRDAKNGECLNFSCIAQQLRTVTTEKTDIIYIPEPDPLDGQEAKNPKETTAQKEKPKGNKPSKDATPERRKSMAAKLLDKGGSFFK